MLLPHHLLLLTLPQLLLLHPLGAVTPQCFHFTWIGPYDNKSNIRSESCEQRVGDYNDIPCSMPLVATENDTVPDVKAMWRNQTVDRSQFVCSMTPGYSCVKYSYIFKGGIQNITYMCARVNITNGCYRETLPTGMQHEACVCTSRVGLIPCNRGAARLGQLSWYQFLGLAFCLLNTLLLRFNKQLK